MRRLTPYETYSREEVHDIFSPDTAFTPQAGTWGLHGIIKVPNRPRDFVFFVTFGQRQGDHEFDEGVTESGVLSWQSQPRQALANPQIQELLSHDEFVNSIYLFLRPSSRQDYYYLGRLKYLLHDNERENPVWFQWQILDWDPPQSLLEKIQAVSRSPLNSSVPDAPDSRRQNGLILGPPPDSPPSATTTREFRATKVADFAEKDAKNRKLGLAGEHAVLKYERKRLEAMGRLDLANRVHHVSAVEGDGAGYDILSFDENGGALYIEVKTTRGYARTAFFMSRNEVEFARLNADNYVLYRLFDFDTELGSGRFFTVTALFETMALTPTEYRLTLTTRAR